MYSTDPSQVNVVFEHEVLGMSGRQVPIVSNVILITVSPLNVNKTILIAFVRIVAKKSCKKESRYSVTFQAWFILVINKAHNLGKLSKSELIRIEDKLCGRPWNYQSKQVGFLFLNRLKMTCILFIKLIFVGTIRLLMSCCDRKIYCHKVLLSEDVCIHARKINVIQKR